MLNVGSLVLGLIAWILPILNLTQYKKQDHYSWAVLSIISVSACASSLCLQLFNTYHLVKIEDWPALLDTMGAVTFVSAVLLIMTLILNGITLILYHRRVTSAKG